MKYVRDLHNADDRVQSISPQIHKSNRPFVGIVVVCEDHMYCVPLDHPKAKHYKMKNDVDFTRIFDGEKLMGVMNFNNMIPVLDEVLIEIYIANIQDVKYRRLLQNQYNFIKADEKGILKTAENLRNLIIQDESEISEYDKIIKLRCCNLNILEDIFKDYKV